MGEFDPLKLVMDSTLQDIFVKTGFRTLMVTRTLDNDWVVYRTLDQEGSIADGHVFNWSDSICCRRMRGEGPEISPDVEEVPAYREAPIRKLRPVRAYFGVPMMNSDGSLMGMLCGMDPEPSTSKLLSVKDTLDHHARTLTALLKARMHIVEKQRATHSDLPSDLTDKLTQLGNRLAWDRMIALEEPRHEATGGVGAVISIGLDKVRSINVNDGELEGDYEIVKCARVINTVTRPGDFAARYGGDEFGLLLPETSSTRARFVQEELRLALQSARMEASVGLAFRTLQSPFNRAALIADSMMYEEKARHKRQMAA